MAEYFFSSDRCCTFIIPCAPRWTTGRVSGTIFVCVWYTVSDVSIYSRNWQNIKSKIGVFAEPVLRTEEFFILPSHLNRCFSSISPADQVLTTHALCICCRCWRLKTVLCNKLVFGYIRGGCCPSGALYILISATLNLSSAAFNLPASLVFSQTLCKHNIKSLEILLCYNDTRFCWKRVIAHRHLKAAHTGFYHFITWNCGPPPPPIFSTSLLCCSISHRF